MSRTKRAMRRKNDIKKARRKQGLDHVRTKANAEDMAFDNLHQYSKDSPIMHNGYHKLHNKLYGKKLNPSASYTRRLDRMNYIENENT